VTNAEIENVEPDSHRALEFLKQAKTFLADAGKEDIALESAVVLQWNACISAMDAALTHAGLRVTSGAYGHGVRVRAAESVLGAGYEELFERMDVWRRERGDVSYAAVQPSGASVDAMESDARDLVAAVEQLVI
jgi:hypothetical protein